MSRDETDVTTPKVAGWYPDPSGERGKKYFDGQEWHSDVPRARKRTSPQKIKVIVGAAALVVLVIGTIATSIALITSEPQPVPGAQSPTNGGGPSTTAPPSYISVKTLPKDGIYAVGGDQVDPGVWESAGPVAPGAPCAWARLRAPQQTPENTIEAGGSDNGPTQVHVQPTDAAFATKGCQPWQLVGPLMPPMP